MTLTAPPPATVADNVRAALAEDIGTGDVTAGLIDPAQQAHAVVISREPATVCGRAWVDETFRQIDSTLAPEWRVREGEQVSADTPWFTVSGNARAILSGERTALNFLQMLSGTATGAHRYQSLVAHTTTRILDTRKTIPGLRVAQKYAVACGGAANHRTGLFDAFLVKENHIRAAGSIAAAVAGARTAHPDLRLEVEVETMAELREALDAAPDWVLLDNFPLDDLREAVRANNHAVKLEASGGIEADADLVQIAETGVDFVSVGALTKHIRAIDLSMQFSVKTDG